MTKEEAIKKIQKSKLTEKDKISIFNWYLKQCDFPLNNLSILTAKSVKGKQLLDYSMRRIEEYLGLRPTIQYIK